MVFNFRAVGSRLTKILLTLVFLATAAVGLLLTPPTSPTAIAAPPLQAITAQSTAADRNAKLDLDAVAGEGATEQVEAKVQKLSSSVQGKVDEAAAEAKLQTAQARNRVEPDADFVDNTVTQSPAATESSKNNLINGIKDFFKS